MCYRLEFQSVVGKSKNRMSGCRLALSIIGFAIVLSIGVVAALLASKHEEWLPSYKGDDLKYWSISQHKNVTQLYGGRIFNLTSANGERCDNFGSLQQGRVVFQCGTLAKARCIYMDNVCDNKQHCPDNSDESSQGCHGFCQLASKRGLRFYCDVKVGLNATVMSKCLSEYSKCDGKVQCTGESDENNDESQCEGMFINKGKAVCSPTHNWLCGDNSQCIRSSDVCNGINNCDDGSDERESVCTDDEA